MGYDSGDSFPFDFESNGNPFGSKSNGKLSPRTYLIQYERKYSFLNEPNGIDSSGGITPRAFIQYCTYLKHSVC